MEQMIELTLNVEKHVQKLLQHSVHNDWTKENNYNYIYNKTMLILIFAALILIFVAIVSMLQASLKKRKKWHNTNPN